jgi:hypothetical protein
VRTAYPRTRMSRSCRDLHLSGLREILVHKPRLVATAQLAPPRWDSRSLSTPARVAHHHKARAIPTQRSSNEPKCSGQNRSCPLPIE